MNIKILKEKENSLLNRKEILAEVDSPNKTPTNEEVKKELASKLKTKEELVVIKSIQQIYGKMTSKVEAHIYKDEKSLKETETIKEKPKGEAKPEQKPEAPKEQPKPEEKKEEPKEEKPKEEKKE